MGGATILALLAGAIAQRIANTWLGLLITVVLVAYAVYKFRSKSESNDANPTTEQLERTAKRKGLNDIAIAAASGDASRLAELIDRGVDVNSRAPDGTTALMYAARNNHVECIRILIAAGADPNIRSHAGSSPESIAEKFGYPEAVQELRTTQPPKSLN